MSVCKTNHFAWFLTTRDPDWFGGYAIQAEWRALVVEQHVWLVNAMEVIKRLVLEYMKDISVFFGSFAGWI